MWLRLNTRKWPSACQPGPAGGASSSDLVKQSLLDARPTPPGAGPRRGQQPWRACSPLVLVRLSSERARQAVRQDGSLAKKQKSSPALLVVVRGRTAPRGAI